MIRRIGIALGAVAATLTLAASAQAATHTDHEPAPGVHLCDVGDPVVDAVDRGAGGTIVSYRVDYGDLTTGAAGYKYTSALSTTIGGLVNGHQYVVRVRALEYRNGALNYSASSGRTFKRLCLIIAPERLRQYVAYNPFPECIMCGRLEDILDIEDPVIRKQISVATLPAAERLKGITLEADGSVLFG